MLIVWLDFTQAVSNRQTLEAQLKENEMVQRELQGLAATSHVYKLIGPTLIEQEQSEALSNVSKRIAYIGQGIKKAEELLKELEKKEQAKGQELMQLQQKSP